jgi:predicted O-methyltransferase YrrM
MTYPEAYYHFLILLARLKRPSLVVELGTREGYGAHAFVEGGARRVVTFDTDVATRRSECDHQLIEFRCQDSLKVDPYLTPIDLLFIDTDKSGMHYGDRAFAEYEAWESQVAPDGLILFDDVQINRSMWQMWSEFSPRRGTKLTLDVHGGCWMGAVVLHG